MSSLAHLLSLIHCDLAPECNEYFPIWYRLPPKQLLIHQNTDMFFHNMGIEPIEFSLLYKEGPSYLNINKYSSINLAFLLQVRFLNLNLSLIQIGDVNCQLMETRQNLVFNLSYKYTDFQLYWINFRCLLHYLHLSSLKPPLALNNYFRKCADLKKYEIIIHIKIVINIWH